MRFGSGMKVFEIAERGVYAIEVMANRLGRLGIALGIGRDLGEVFVANLGDHQGVVDRLVSGPLAAGLGSVTLDRAALVEIILIPGAVGGVGHVIELEPV